MEDIGEMHLSNGPYLLAFDVIRCIEYHCDARLEERNPMGDLS